MTKLERKIQEEILHYIRTERRDIFAFKVITANERGIPDIVCCKDGQFITLEVKRPGEHLTPIQIEQTRRINMAGGMACVVHSLEEAKEMLK